MKRYLPLIRAALALLVLPFAAGCPQPQLEADPGVAMQQGFFMGQAKLDAVTAANETEELLNRFHAADAERRRADLYAKYAFVTNAFKQAGQKLPPEQAWELLMEFEKDSTILNNTLAEQKAGIWGHVAKLKANAGDWDAMNQAMRRRGEVTRQLEREDAAKVGSALETLAAEAAAAQARARQDVESELEPEAPAEHHEEEPAHHQPEPPPAPPAVSNGPAVQPKFWRTH